MRVFQDLTGQKFNRLLVLGKEGSTKQQATIWKCRCDCGTETKVRTACLKNGGTKSCGCLRGTNNRGGNNYRVKQMIAKYGEWMSSKNYWYARAKNIMYRASREGTRVDFKSPYEFARYLEDLQVSVCPVFGEPLVRGDKKSHDFSPSIDRVIPKLGYVPGNIQVISQMANAMKQNATPNQLVRFAVWALKSVLGKDVQILIKGEEA